MSSIVTSLMTHSKKIKNSETNSVAHFFNLNDYTCDKQVLWESAGAFFRATTLSFQPASRIVQAFVV